MSTRSLETERRHGPQVILFEVQSLPCHDLCRIFDHKESTAISVLLEGISVCWCMCMAAISWMNAHTEESSTVCNAPWRQQRFEWEMCARCKWETKHEAPIIYTLSNLQALPWLVIFGAKNSYFPG